MNQNLFWAAGLPVAIVIGIAPAGGTPTPSPVPAQAARQHLRVFASHGPGVRVGGPASIPRLGRRGMPPPPAAAPSSPLATPRLAPLTAVSATANQHGLGANGVTPSDSTGAIGPNHYIEAVNLQFGLYDRTLSSPIAVVAMSTFLGTSGGLSPADPQVQWDEQGGRWLYSAIEYSSTAAQVAFGWSRNGDPTTLTLNNSDWCNFHAPATSGELFDYDKLGHDKTFILVGANDFPLGSVNFKRGVLLAIPKPSPLDTTCPTLSSIPVFDLGPATFTPVPGNVTDGGATAYTVAINPSAVGVWHISPAAVGVCTVPPCVVQDGNIPVTSWSLPPGNADFQVPQPGGQNIDGLDGRLTQAVEHADPRAGGAEAVWTQHTTSSVSGRSVVTWFELLPSLCSVGSCPASAKRQEGTLSNPSLYLFNAAISPTSNGDAAIIDYNTGSATTYTDVRAQSHDAADPAGAMGGELVLRDSTVPDLDLSCSGSLGPPCRWGDYAGASPDPSDCATVWGSSMLMGNSAGSVGGAPSWVTQNFALQEGALRSTVSRQQYVLTGSDGSAWLPVDATRLQLSSAPCQSSTAIITANADLWTSQAGVNQDLGIFLDVDGAPATSPIAWKESGGFNGTFSPNAAYVQAEITMTAGHTYTARLMWKSNVPTSGSIYMGAGPLPDQTFSPSRLTIRLVTGGAAQAEIVTQPRLTHSDGATWTPIPGATWPLAPLSNSRAVFGGNADLWTDTTGFNQDIGIELAGGSFGLGTLLAWKESGGFNGTFSPNAAFVQAVADLTGGQAYTVTLVWKTNKPAPVSASIYAGAGPLPGTASFSPTTLIANLLPAGSNPSASIIVTQPMQANSNGQTWAPLPVQVTVPAAPASVNALVTANADLWTANAGFNQDLAIFVSDDSGPPQLLAWKESGGFGGTFSPNAAFVETVFPMTEGHSYVFSLAWKTNRASGATIYAGAGPIAGAFSPTTLTVTET